MTTDPIAEARRVAVEALRLDVDAWITDPDWTRLLDEQGPEVTIGRLCEDLAAQVGDSSEPDEVNRLRGVVDDLAGLAAAAMVALMRRTGGASR